MATGNLHLVPDLDYADLVQELMRVWRMEGCCNRAMAFYLHEMQRRKVCQMAGYPDAVSFAAGVLGMSRRKAQWLIAAGAKLLELRGLDAAFRDGALCWSKVRALLSVVTVETEQAWVERATEVGVREVVKLCKQAKPGLGPGDGGEGGLNRVKFRVEFELGALEYEELAMARRKLQAELGAELSVGDAVRVMAQGVLASRPDGTVPGRVAVDESIYRVIVGEGSAGGGAHVCAEDGDEGADAAAVAAAVSDGVVPEAMRERVLARDGHRCARCARKAGLQVHHVTWRSRGGLTEMRNLLALCSHCHGLVHYGLLRVEGEVGKDRRLVIEAVQRVARPVGMTMTLEAGAGLDGRREVCGEEIEVHPDDDPGLTMESIASEVTAEWWRKHEHRFVWGPRGITRVKRPRTRVRGGDGAWRE